MNAIMVHDFITAIGGRSEKRTMPVLVMAVVLVGREVLVGGMPFDDMTGWRFHSTETTFVVWPGSDNVCIGVVACLVDDRWAWLRLRLESVCPMLRRVLGRNLA